MLFSNEGTIVVDIIIGSRGWLRVMAATHVSIPKSFSSEDTTEWFQKLQLCRVFFFRLALRFTELLVLHVMNIWV